MDRCVRRLKHITGHKEQPKVQQQQTQPQNNHFAFIGNVRFKMLFTRDIVALYSSGATRDIKDDGKSSAKRLLKPNL